MEHKEQQKRRKTRHVYVYISELLLKAKIKFKTTRNAKLAFLIFTQIWPDEENDHTALVTGKKEALDILGVHIDSTDQNAYLKKVYKKAEGEIEVDDPDPEKEGNWTHQLLFYGEAGFDKRGEVVFKMNPELLREHFQHLFADQKFYRKVWVDDIFALPTRKTDTPYAVYLYLDLLAKSRLDKDINSTFYTTKELKELFDMSVEAYTDKRIDPKTGETVLHFRRSTFENRVLDTALKDIADHAVAIHLIPLEKDGENVTKNDHTVYYKKERGEGGSVKGYSIRYRIEKDLDKKYLAQQVDSGTPPESLGDELAVLYLEQEVAKISGSFSQKDITKLVKKGKEATSEVLEKYTGSTEVEKILSFIQSSYLTMISRQERGGPVIKNKVNYLLRIMDNEIKEAKEESSRDITPLQENTEEIAESLRQDTDRLPKVLKAIATRRSYDIDFDKIKKMIRDDMDLSPLFYNTFVQPLFLLITGTDIFVFGVALENDPFAVRFYERRFKLPIEEKMEQVYGIRIEAVFLNDEESDSIEHK